MKKFDLKFLKSSKFRHGTAATVFAVVFIVVVVVLNVLVSALTERYPSIDIDMTAEGLNTLSESAIEVARDANYDTTIYIVGSEDAIRGDQLYLQYQQYGIDIKYSIVANLADRLVEVNPEKIKVQYIDPDLDASFMSEHADEGLYSGSVLVETERRSKALQANDMFNFATDQNNGSYVSYNMVDGALANAIYLTNLETVPVAAIVTNHSEMFDSSSRTALVELLEDNSFEVREISLMTEEITDDIRLLLLPTPTTDFSDAEIEKLRGYMNNSEIEDHALWVTCDPRQPEMPVFNHFLEEYGLSIGSGIVLETDENKMITPYAFLAENVFEDLEENSYPLLLAAQARPIEILFDFNDDISVKALIQTGDTAYVSADSEDGGDSEEGGDQELSDAAGTDEEDDAAPETSIITTAAMARKYYQIGNYQYKANLTVFGDTLPFSASYLQSTAFSNRSYVTDMIKNTTGTADTRIGLSVNRVESNARDITASSAVVNFVGLTLFTILIPLAILVVGLVVFLRRRHL